MLRSLFNRILLFYSALIFLLVASICTVVFFILSKDIRSNKLADMSSVAAKISGQLDLRVKEMNQISYGVLANTGVRQSLLSLEGYDYGSVNMFVYLDAYNRIVDNLFMIAQPFPDIERIAVFSDRNMFFSSRRFDSKSDALKARLAEKRWADYGPLSESAGFILVGPHADEWDESGDELVFSLQRVVKGSRGRIGLIEIQARYGIIEDVCDVGTGYVYVLDEASRPVFPIGSAPEPGGFLSAYFESAASGGASGPISVDVGGKGRERLVAVGKTSDFTAWTTVYAQSEQWMLKPIYKSLEMIAIVGLIGIVLSFFVAYMIADHIYRPLRRLKNKVEDIELRVLGEDAAAAGDGAFVDSDAEIAVLNKAFDLMVGKLRQSVEETIRTRAQVQKSHFKMLQSQINPHFLHNTLSVISVMAKGLGDRKIPDICRNLTSLLKYASDVRMDTATIAEELECVRAYLGLLKYRYEHRLEYSIEADDEILRYAIPKMTLQPLVENSIKHGLYGINRTLRVDIRGRAERGGWSLRLSDNGRGIKPPDLELLRSSLSGADLKADGPGDGDEADARGLGVANTYSRLRLTFGDRLSFAIGNAGDDGAEVSIRVVAQARKGAAGAADIEAAAVAGAM